jgi:hypothetical protein
VFGRMCGVWCEGKGMMGEGVGILAIKNGFESRCSIGDDRT